VIIFVRLSTGGIVITHARDVVARLRQLSDGYDEPVRLLYEMRGEPLDAEDTRRRFGGLRLGKTQQFRPGSDLLEFIDCLERIRPDDFDDSTECLPWRGRCDEPIRVPPEMSYEEYLATMWWAWRRGRTLRQDGYRCRRCGTRKGLQVHHLSYKHLGDEPDEDLVTLCRECHARFHGKLPAEILAQIGD
jgi:HNH endonuclease